MRTKRHLGQNFLTGTHYPSLIVDSVRPMPDEHILEIGPGEGALTALLLGAGARVTAVEVDPDLIPRLQQRFGKDPRFNLLEADALKVDLCRLVDEGCRIRVVANLPYYISTPLIQRLIEQRHCLSEMTLMLQREVVERIIAPPGGKDYGYLSVLVQLHAVVARLFDVPPGAFRPVPKVTSSVIRLRLQRQSVVSLVDERLFLLLAQVLFAQRRKTILNNLRAGFARLGLESAERLPAILELASLDGRRRAETLSLDEMAGLANLLGSMH